MAEGFVSLSDEEGDDLIVDPNTTDGRTDEVVSRKRLRILAPLRPAEPEPEDHVTEDNGVGKRPRREAEAVSAGPAERSRVRLPALRVPASSARPEPQKPEPSYRAKEAYEPQADEKEDDIECLTIERNDVFFETNESAEENRYWLFLENGRGQVGWVPKALLERCEDPIVVKQEIGAEAEAQAMEAAALGTDADWWAPSHRERPDRRTQRNNARWKDEVTAGVDEIYSAGVIVLGNGMIHCIKRFSNNPRNKKLEFAKTRLDGDEAAPAAAVRALRKEGGIQLDVSQLQFVTKTEYRFGQAWKTVNWYVHHCNGSVPIIGDFERGTLSSNFVPLANVMEGPEFSRDLRDLVRKCLR